MRTAMLIPVILITALLALPASAAKDFYKWKDENGVTHYSARKPHDRDSEVVSVTTGQRTRVDAGSSAAAAGQQGSEGNAAASGIAQSMQDPERCAAARNNLEILRNNPRVRIQDEDSGEIRYLSEAEQAEKTREFEQAVQEAC